MRKIKYFTTAALLAAVTAATMTACAQTPASIPASITMENQGEHTILVQSSEKVSVVPDIAEIQFSVTTQAADPKACQEQNSRDLEQVITFLKNSGLKEESIQTSSYGLNPTYDWNSGQNITGYEMSASITVSDVPMDQVSVLLTSSVEAGINSISQVAYLSSQYDAAYEEALTKAVESARKKASAIAAASEKTLGNVINVEEYNPDTEARYTGYDAGAGDEVLASKQVSMGVEPGQIGIEARIAVTFEIN